MIIRNKSASALEIERWLRRHGFTSHPSERTWYVNDAGARVILRRRAGGSVKTSVYMHDQATGDRWSAQLDDAPLWAVAMLLEWEPEPAPALADDGGAVR